MRLLLRSFLFTLLAITFSSMNVFSQSATISTDQPDYAPGSTVIISGTGFQPGETVTLQVLHDPTGGDDATSPAHQPWTVVADASGNISSTWLVPGDEDELGATLKLTAVGGNSGLMASVEFTDSPKLGEVKPITQTSTICANSGGTVSFSYTVTRGNNTTGNVTADISISGLPTGVSVSSGLPLIGQTIGSTGYNGTFSLSIANNVPSGEYTFTITADGPGNDNAVGTGILKIADPITLSSAGVTTPIACNGGNATVTIAATGGTGTLHYTFDGVTNTSGVFTHAAGTGLDYSITDDNSCGPVTGTVDITQPDAIAVASSSKTDVSCNGGSDGSITLGTVTGGTPAYVYSWTISDGAIPSGQEHNKDLTGLTAGTYHYSVTDQHNCTAATGDVVVGQPDAIAVADDGSKTDVSCNGGSDGSITLGTVTGGTPAYVYSWTTSDGAIPSGQEHNKDLTGLTA
ncbi:MAG TPA: SprB repeat-containing protein, partial [Hanamia sp.]|nr:SprB repeat-containing protein [Hanamia sp.]